MGRPLRFDPAFGWHHVMNRGVARQEVFLNRGDGRMFESLMADGHDLFGVEIHAYCLMPNHFHALLHCPEGGLSAYMQRLSSMYTRYLNARRGHDGPIFRGRFRSLVIDTEAYLARAGRYIHRNPLDIRPRVDLAEYRWSSLRYYCGGVQPPPWLSLSLSAAHGGPADYRSFVERDGDSAAVGSVEWAIAMAVAEVDGTVADRSNVHRTIALLMLDRADQPTAAVLERMLDFPSAGARRTALCRARGRLDQENVLGFLADRALRLAS